MSGKSLRNPARIGVAFLGAMALLTSQAAAATLQERFEAAFAEIFCKTDLRERLEPIEKHQNWLNVVRLGPEGVRESNEFLDAEWGKVLPFLEKKLQKRGLVLSDLKTFLPTDYGSVERSRFADAVAKKTKALCPMRVSRELDIDSSVHTIANRIVPMHD